jgi:hypothetical protein
VYNIIWNSEILHTVSVRRLMMLRVWYRNMKLNNWHKLTVVPKLNLGVCCVSNEKAVFHCSRQRQGFCFVCNVCAHSIICTVRLFRGKMHSDWFNGIEILQGRWQHGEKVWYCYPSGLEKTLCKRYIYVPLVVKGLNTERTIILTL